MSEKEWNKLGAYLKETQILGSIQSTLYWDQNTGMPNKGASWRSEQLTYIAKILHKRNSSEEFSDLIKAAQDEFRDGLEKSLNQEIIRSKKRNLELLIKEFNRQKNLDPKLVEALAKAKSKGYESWQEAKRRSDFEIFLPIFKKLIELRIEETKQISDKYSPWVWATAAVQALPADTHADGGVFVGAVFSAEALREEKLFTAAADAFSDACRRKRTLVSAGGGG